ncbi:hypothetical protein TIFTF001_005820 [Ficus carica]|uniref:Uncharacterized protein n=1 Tax=Ficus carica TaxID=3494 RepID=A0AA87ZMU1_FICCA|nr:hypothetical protein TIFTF001_005820 [Ficus carica]
MVVDVADSTAEGKKKKAREMEEDEAILEVDWVSKSGIILHSTKLFG